jgi:hypothetical protein
MPTQNTKQQRYFANCFIDTPKLLIAVNSILLFKETQNKTDVKKITKENSDEMVEMVLNEINSSKTRPVQLHP